MAPWPFTHGIKLSWRGTASLCPVELVPEGGTVPLHRTGEELHEQGWRAPVQVHPADGQLPRHPSCPHGPDCCTPPPSVNRLPRRWWLATAKPEGWGSGRRKTGKGGRRRGQGEGRGERCPRSAKGTRGSQLPGEQSAWALQARAGPHSLSSACRAAEAPGQLLNVC